MVIDVYDQPPGRSERSATALGKVIRAPASLTGELAVILTEFSEHFEYQVPGGQWMPRGVGLPSVGDRCLVVFDDNGDAWVPGWVGVTLGGAVGPPGPGGNAVPNPTFADGLTGYAVSPGGTLELDLTNGRWGPQCAKVTRVGTLGDLALKSPHAEVDAGDWCKASVSIRLGSLGSFAVRTAQVSVEWLDALGNPVGTSVSPAYAESVQGNWVDLTSGLVRAPDTAAFGVVVATVAGVAVGDYYLVDGFQLDPGQASFNAGMAESTFSGQVLVPNAITARESAPGSGRAFYGPATGRASVTGQGIGSGYYATDTHAFYIWDGTTWQLISGGGASGGLGVPWTFDPALADGASATRTLNSANVHYFRVRGGVATCNGLGVHIQALLAGSTVQAAVYDNTGSGRSARPNNRKANSLVTIDTSAVGLRTANFSSPVVIAEGDWFGICPSSSATLAFLTGGAAPAGAGTGSWDGFAHFQTGGAPTPPSSASATLSPQPITPLIVGV